MADARRIVVNDCAGGFSLSPEAARALIALGHTGITVTETERVGTDGLVVDGDDRLPRDDADLVAVVAALGPAASGRYANLRIVEIPPEVEWRIEEAAGREEVHEVHRVWRP